MPILVRNILLGLDEPEERLAELLAKRLRLPTKAIRHYAVVRRSIDARKKDIRFSYQVEVAIEGTRRAERAQWKRIQSQDITWLEPIKTPAPCFGEETMPERPIIIGFGPGGMFAALRLAQLGYKPLVLERGREVRRRHRDIMQRFYRERDFDPTSNLLFGEGGAGTYSDGKLYTRINDPLCRWVLEALYHHGARPDILVDARPHIGSNRLPTICTRIRRKIESLGGEIRFESRVEDVRIEEDVKSGPDRRLVALKINDEWIPAGPTLLAIGHSARDTIRMLHERGVRIEPKPFQLGVRIEHPQVMVDRWQYGAAAGHRKLAPAEYHMVAKGAGDEHGDVFSFCMCPGGTILPTNESPGLVVTNGASRSGRSSSFANSGFVITLDPSALGLSALEGLDYQARWEKLAFECTQGTYAVPAQRASDFLAGKRSSGTLAVSCPLGGKWESIRTIIPEMVAKAIERALPMLNAKFPGFSGDESIITGPETRASGPLRILRDVKTRLARGVDLLYPVGEGAGYAGGIISAAVDGIKSADAIIGRYAPVR
ncbi:MAG: FAD-dependent oxidoreductase [Planctomycetes bacterium]|nr:FAD-dependent oxidoreductase [Planctomycetota bacterium]